MPTIEVSENCYNELLIAFKKHGVELNAQPGTIEIKKSTNITPPYNFSLATVRRDCANIVAQYWEPDQGSFLDELNRLFKFVLYNEMPKTNEWK